MLEPKRKTDVASSSVGELEYRGFREFLEQACGIVLGENKQYLVSSRMKKVLSEFKLGTLTDLMHEMKAGRIRGLRERVIEAMTTNETSWFRDRMPFEALRTKILPELARQETKRLRIWSAACSSGQEPYSISMTVHEFQMFNPGLLTQEVEIIATDISPAILSAASRGVYDEPSLARGLSEERRRRYFERTPEGMRVTQSVRDRIQFRELNLLKSYALLGRFDVVFCRNVLIYFSEESKRDILERIAHTLNPGGYLFLGGSESVTNITDVFEMIKLDGTVVYKIKKKPHYTFS